MSALSPQARSISSVTVGDLATSRHALPGSLTCREMDRWFRSDDTRRSAVLERADGSVGLLNRSAFYQYLLGPLGYGWALHAQEPIRRLPAPPGLVLEADSLVVDAGLRLLAGEVSSGDDLLVVGGLGPATIGTSRVLAELAYVQTAQTGRLEALLENLRDVIVVVDERGIVLDISSSTHAVSGHSASERVGRSCLDNIHPDDKAIVGALLREACASPGETTRGEARLRSRDGRDLVINLAFTDRRSHPGIDGIVLTYRDITEHRAHEAELRHLALHDGLTGLANRALLKDRITHALAGASRSGKAIAVVYLDLDGFKAVNDGWGHASGDAVLQAVSAALNAETRPGDTVARVGGDEFVVLLEHLQNPGEAAAFASRLHQALEEVILDGLHIRIRCSVGIAAAGGRKEVLRGGAEELIRRADAAMYHAKSEGPSRTTYWKASIERDAIAADRLIADLAGAAERAELLLHYQPIINVADGSVRGLEALVRWNHPTRGLIPPADFIPLAERTGAIRDITSWVLHRACSDTGHFNEQRTTALTVAVNLSASELVVPRVVDDVASVLEDTGFPPSLLELEITETALVSDFPLARASITRLKELGVTIAIDDFGTGYSSLSYLQELPVDRVKIDKVFTDRLIEESGASLVRSVIDMAHSLHLKVTAEGIESVGQAQALAALHCDQGQGYFHARPAPLEELDLPLGEATNGSPVLSGSRVALVR